MIIGRVTTAIPVEQPAINGMTLRDYFAASFITSGVVFKNLSSGSTTDEVAAQAYALADAMLKARQA
jgi:hypothetical protein